MSRKHRTPGKLAHEACLYNGEIKAKTASVFDALGDIDELSAHLGLAACYAEDACASATLENRTLLVSLTTISHEIQCDLIDLMSHLATPINSPHTSAASAARAEFAGAHRITRIETHIENCDRELPVLTRFILPGGGRTSASFHVARTVCRRAERVVCALLEAQLCAADAQEYLNRCSDLLFVMARLACKATAGEEVAYKKPRRDDDLGGGLPEKQVTNVDEGAR